MPPCWRTFLMRNDRASSTAASVVLLGGWSHLIVPCSGWAICRRSSFSPDHDAAIRFRRTMRIRLSAFHGPIGHCRNGGQPEALSRWRTTAMRNAKGTPSLGLVTRNHGCVRTTGSYDFRTMHRREFAHRDHDDGVWLLRRMRNPRLDFMPPQGIVRAAGSMKCRHIGGPS